MELRFDFATDDNTAGFRLEFFELYNWGTYNKSIVKLDLAKNNALLTGDIGSGKSTVVDALTTLLVPHQKITYNKAAGAEAKERSLYSYIIGEYKTTQDDSLRSAKAVALRDDANFTVLLARFENVGFDESVTIAQFFYIGNNRQVNKFFIVSQVNISIKNNFFDFDDIRSLKKRLKETPHTDVYDSFRDYSIRFNRIVGIKNEQALNLFYQTVSLKSIGNLTEFIRVHMLENSDIDTKIQELCSNFVELNHTYNLVLRAKRQIELLTPIDKQSKQYNLLIEKKEEHIRIRESLSVYFASIKMELLTKRLEELNIEFTKHISNKKLSDEVLESLNEKIIDLTLELQKNGGDRLKQLEVEIKSHGKLLFSIKEEHQNYNTLIKKLDFKVVSNEHSFLLTNKEVQKRYESMQSEQDTLKNTQVINQVSLSRYSEKSLKLNEEILYLKSHPSNIPHHIFKIREEILRALYLESHELPFVGELIHVKDEKWHGAIERVMHNFALSLLVDKSIYEKVSEYVESTNLYGKIVYLKVDINKKNRNYPITVQNSLLEKIELKTDSSYFDELNYMLIERFNFSCVENIMDFRKLKKALSINGQFKTNLTKHEKDDRFKINDKSRWVLGWDNILKLQEFEKEFTLLTQKIQKVQDNIQEAKVQEKQLESTRDTLRDVLKYDSFESINWYKISKKIEDLVEEKSELEKSSDVIKSIQLKIQETKDKQKEEKLKNDSLSQKEGKLQQQIDSRKIELEETIVLLQSEELQNEVQEKIDDIKAKLIREKINLVNIISSEKILRQSIQSELDTNQNSANKLSEKLISNMNKFITEFPIFSKEFDATLFSCGEFSAKLQELKKENLPKWEKKFKELFKEKTIQKIVALQGTLEDQANQITDKITNINKSLEDIEYSDGTYIELIAEKSNISDIKEFKERLKQVTTGAINEDQSYNEQKFIQIKDIIDRFNGRENYVDVDKKWRKIVTDVRNWYDFSAKEKYLSDGSLKEYYASTGGKSGGQKEKLAYTVLASSLAYQFGLEHDKIQSRSFRFVMIDEAFGRGSDESTRYALKLFEKLKLQLLVITPKTKINVIEPFVKSVHFVHNQDSMNSSLVTLSIEDFQNNRIKDKNE